MGNVAKLFPYRDSNGRLMFRGKVGCKKADGVTEGVSKFFPVRVDGRLLLRGKGPDGKILWGFPYRDENGRLMGETYAGPCTVTAFGLYGATCPFNCSYTLQASGFTGGLASLNGSHVVTYKETTSVNLNWWGSDDGHFWGEGPGFPRIDLTIQINGVGNGFIYVAITTGGNICTAYVRAFSGGCPNIIGWAFGPSIPGLFTGTCPGGGVYWGSGVVTIA